jgi:hypothetical protein
MVRVVPYVHTHVYTDIWLAAFWFNGQNMINLSLFWDHLCGLVVRVPGYSSTGPGSIPGATRFSEK